MGGGTWAWSVGVVGFCAVLSPLKTESMMPERVNELLSAEGEPWVDGCCNCLSFSCLCLASGVKALMKVGSMSEERERGWKEKKRQRGGEKKVGGKRMEGMIDN